MTTSKLLTIAGASSGGSDSTLSIVNTSFSVPGDTTGVTLAELSLYIGKKPAQGQTSLTFDYNLLLSFTTPSGSQSETFNLGMTGSGSGSGSELDLSGFGPITLDPLALTGVTLSNFHFVTVSGDSNSAFSGTQWTATDDQTTHLLYLVADVTATNEGPSGDPTPIPEPATLALFGAGLLGLGIRRRRRGDRAQ